MNLRGGSASLFSKKILEFRKSGFNISKLSLIFPIVYIFIFSKFYEKMPEGIGSAIVVVIISTTSVGFDIREFFVQEFKKHYVYLIPESSLKKGFYLTLMPVVIAAIKGILYFTIIFIFYKVKIINLVFLYLMYFSIVLVHIYSAMFSERLAGSYNNMIINLFFRMIVSIFTFIPIVAAVILATSFEIKFTVPLLTMFVAPVNILFAAVFLFLSRKIFEVAELTK